VNREKAFKILITISLTLVFLATISFIANFKGIRRAKIENLEIGEKLVVSATCEKELHVVFYRTFSKPWLKNVKVEIYGIKDLEKKEIFYGDMKVVPGQIIDLNQYVGDFREIEVVVYIDGEEIKKRCVCRV